MAKEYAYYIEGNKVAIVERDTAFNNDLTSHEFGPGVVRNMWKSPQSSVTDGLEIKYAYSPKYRIESIAAADIETVTSYETADGFLRFNGTGFSTESSVDYIVISGSEKWNGLHKVTGLNTAHYTTSTKYSGANVTETPTIYTDIDVLNDEADDIDLPSYLEKALVYYIKGRLAEDSGNIEIKEYMMREYKKHIEVYESSLMKGPRIISSGHHAIR